MKIGLTGGILQSIVCSGPLLFRPSIFYYDIYNDLTLENAIFDAIDKVHFFKNDA